MGVVGAFGADVVTRAENENCGAALDLVRDHRARARRDRRDERIERGVHDVSREAGGHRVSAGDETARGVVLGHAGIEGEDEFLVIFRQPHRFADGNWHGGEVEVAGATGNAADANRAVMAQGALQKVLHVEPRAEHRAHVGDFPGDFVHL